MMRAEKKRLILSVAILLLAIVADQVIKFAVKLSMFKHESIRVFDWFYIYFTENKGMAFGMELFDKVFLTGFRMVAVVFICYYLFKIIRFCIHKSVGKWAKFGMKSILTGCR